MCVLTYRCLTGTAPHYLGETICPVSSCGTCQHLRSAETSTLLVPSTRRSTLGDRSFSVAAARAWNALPQHSACSESVGGPSCAARGRQPQFRRRSDRWTTSPRPQNAAQRHVSASAARSSAFRAVSRIPVTTSGELILLPVGGRHPKLNLGRCPLARYSDFDISPSSSGTYPAYRTFRVQNGV